MLYTKRSIPKDSHPTIIDRSHLSRHSTAILHLQCHLHCSRAGIDGKSSRSTISSDQQSSPNDQCIDDIRPLCPFRSTTNYYSSTSLNRSWRYTKERSVAEMHALIVMHNRVFSSLFDFPCPVFLFSFFGIKKSSSMCLSNFPTTSQHRTDDHYWGEQPVFALGESSCWSMITMHRETWCYEVPKESHQSGEDRWQRFTPKVQQSMVLQQTRCCFILMAVCGEIVTT